MNHFSHDLNAFPKALALGAESLPGIEADMRMRMQALSEALALHGFRVPPGKEESWDYFRRKPLREIQGIYTRFLTYFSIYQTALSQKERPNEDSLLLWAAIKQLGLRPCSDFFEHVRETDIVEFYSPSLVQVFHNINFFEVCSYSFIEVFSYPFTELWDRDPGAVKEIEKMAIQGFTGQGHHTAPSDIPEHLLTEKFSDDRNIISLKFRSCAPLFGKEGEVAAIAVVSTGKIVGSLLTQRPKLSLVDGPAASI